MQEIINYKYDSFSKLVTQKHQSLLFLADYSEIEESESPILFQGTLENSFIIAKCLIALFNIVKSNFNLSPIQLDLLKDPIITVGNNKIRFEGFSHCASIYARVDIFERKQNQGFIKNGSTNVNFNQDLVSALGGISRNDKIKLEVGRKQIEVTDKNKTIIERKVPLPIKWIKGLINIQQYMSQSDLYFTLDRIQALKLFRSIPASSINSDYYLIKRGNKYIFSPIKAENSIVIGGVKRMKLIEPLLLYIDKLKIYAKNDMQSVTCQLYFENTIFSFSLSRNTWRGFSGEGAVLDSLLEELPNELINKMNNYSYVNQEFNSIWLAIDKNESFDKIDNIIGKLAAVGLLGFDLEYNHYFYRKLPFKINRILSLNPRLKGVERLIEEKKVHIISNIDNKIEAKVEGSGVTHYIVLNDSNEKCTCVWHSQTHGERGPCKHILAVKKITNFKK